jgi:hypothetical protein
MRIQGAWVCAALLSLAIPAGAQTYINFIACPTVRDLGPEVDVCFFADYQGETYHLTPVGVIDWGKPELRHRLLVEGEVVEGQSYCGGKRFIGRTTVLPDVDHGCNEYMPFDNQIVGVQRPDKRADHPKYQAVFEAMKTDPSVSIQPAPVGLPVEGAIKQKSNDGERELVVYFPFNRDRIDGVTAGKLIKFVDAAKGGSDTVTVRSYQAETLLDSGERLSEDAGMAAQRSAKMQRVLTGLGLDADRLKYVVEGRNIPGKGVHDWKNRRIELSLEKGGA